MLFRPTPERGKTRQQGAYRVLPKNHQGRGTINYKTHGQGWRNVYPAGKNVIAGAWPLPAGLIEKSFISPRLHGITLKTHFGEAR